MELHGFCQMLQGKIIKNDIVQCHWRNLNRLSLGKMKINKMKIKLET